MKIELIYYPEVDEGEPRVHICAIDEYGARVARGEGDTLGDAARALISEFAALQRATIESLNASGLVRTVNAEDLETS